MTPCAATSYGLTLRPTFRLRPDPQEAMIVSRFLARLKGQGHDKSLSLSWACRGLVVAVCAAKSMAYTPPRRHDRKTPHTHVHACACAIMRKHVLSWCRGVVSSSISLKDIDKSHDTATTGPRQAVVVVAKSLKSFEKGDF
jgi:hypothetical protein